ncbi:MAG: PAS domain S-box protein [Candidatus Kapabacteria bacterium]|jgi:PAS domain S-box-containing protein|nr:PAS domain S-box protein [Candidatus Kapabacteria bacterium]
MDKQKEQGRFRSSNRITQDIIIISVMSLLTILILAVADKYVIFSINVDLSNVSIPAGIIVFLSVFLVFILVFSVRRVQELSTISLKLRQAERKMQKSTAELKAVLDGVPDMILQVDTNMRILWANKAALSFDNHAIGRLCNNAFESIGENVITPYSNAALTTGVIEKGIKYQSTTLSDQYGSYWEGIGIPLRNNNGIIFGAIAIARDITERMRLGHTSNLLASIVESSDDAIYGMDFKGTILSWNLGAERTYGFSDADISGKSCNNFVPFDNRVELQEIIEKVIRTQTISRFDAVRERKDGTLIDVSVTLCPFVDATGKKIGVSAIERDITERRIAEKALAESENMFRELFEKMRSGAAIYSSINNGKDFVLKKFNHAAEIIDNISQEKIIGCRLSDPISMLHTPQLLEIFKQVYETNTPANKLITIKEDGQTVIWRENHIHKLPTGEIVCIFEDISESRNAQENLKKSEEKFRTLVETAPDGIVLTDGNGEIIEVNEAFANLFGYSKTEIQGKALTEFLADSEQAGLAFGLMRKVLKRGSIKPTEIVAQLKTKEEIPAEIAIASLVNDKNKILGLIAIIRNITVRKQNENDLKESREQMRNLAVHLQTAREEERKAIAFEIHDELGYALTALKLDLVWLSGKMNIKEKILTEKTKTMADLIDLTIHKVRSISTQLRPSILDHFGLIAAIEWQSNEFQKRTAVRCKLRIEPDDMKFKDPYATAMFRILQETLTNITRHAKASRVDVSLIKKDNIVELIIADNGVGITGSQLKAHKSLGLAGIRERAKSIGGDVKIIGSPGAGTTVSVTISMPEQET